MSRIIVIHFAQDQDEQHSLVHRLRNFGEDVFRGLRDNGWGAVSLDEVDRATTHFAITDVKASKLRRLISWIEHEADRQRLRVTAEVR
jgi:hypothetical protein